MKNVPSNDIPLMHTHPVSKKIWRCRLLSLEHKLTHAWTADQRQGASVSTLPLFLDEASVILLMARSQSVQADFYFLSTLIFKKNKIKKEEKWR